MESSSLRCEAKETYQNMRMCLPEKNPTVNDCKKLEPEKVGSTKRPNENHLVLHLSLFSESKNLSTTYPSPIRTLSIDMKKLQRAGNHFVINFGLFLLIGWRRFVDQSQKSV